MGGWPRSRQTGWEAVPWNTLRNDQMVDHEPATKMINNGLIAHGVTLHNVGSHVGLHTDASGSDYQTYTVVPGNNRRIRRIPLKGIMTGASGELRVWVRASRADAASSAFLAVTVGRQYQRISITGGAGSFDWYLLSVPVEFNRSPHLETTDILEVWCGCDWDYMAGDAIQVETVSMHEGYDHLARPWVDTSGANNKIGVADYPFSPAFERVLAYKLSAIRGHRMPRCNLHQQCHLEGWRSIGAAFSANEDGFGRYIIRKPEGTTQIDALYHSLGWDTAIGSAISVDVRLGLWSLESVNYTGQTVNFTDGDILVGQTSGARARILAVNDAGATGAVLVGAIEGTFQIGESLTGEASGGDGVVGAVPLGGGLKVTDVTDTDAPPEVYFTTSIPGLISEDCEYELRIDVKYTGGAPTIPSCNFTQINLVEALDTDVSHVLPSPKHAEEDDDVRAATWLNLDNTLSYLWARRKQILLHDFRTTNGGEGKGVKSSYTGLTFASNDKFGIGALFASQDSRYIAARVRVRKPTLEKVRKLDITGASGVPVVGDRPTGGTSGSSARVIFVSVAAGSGFVTVRDPAGDFITGEALTFVGSGITATASSPIYAFDSSVKIRLAIWTPGGGTYTQHEVDCTSLPRNQPVDINLKTTIPEPFWEDFLLHDTGGAYETPYLWEVKSITDDPSDYLILDDLDVWEEAYPQGGWRMLEHHLSL
uniref:Uncharacterized protein n=1 Tax=viral metagenome TaxID=1070528 RepID=A0A6H1ZTR8_9ZZZZ